MTVENKTPYVIVALLFVIGFCVAAAFLGALGQFTPQDWAEMAGIQAQIPEEVAHQKEMNTITEGIAEETAPSKVENETAALTARAQVWRTAGLIGTLALAVFGGMRVHGMIVTANAQGRERMAAAGLKEVHDEKGKGNPAFTPAGLLTRTTTIEGETFISSDLTGEMVPVRDGARMAEFRNAHLAAMMAVIAAKRDVLIAGVKADGRRKGDEVILIGEGL